MMDLRAASRYSLALYGLAEERKELDAIDDQLIAICGLVAKHPEISHLVLNSTVSLAEKEDFISKIVPAETSPLLVNFVKLLIKKGRFKDLASIQTEFHRFYERNRRIEEITVLSAVALSAENMSRLQKVLEKKLGSAVRLSSKIDSKMIGGLVLRFGGKEVNASFKDRLDSIYQLLNSN